MDMITLFCVRGGALLLWQSLRQPRFPRIPVPQKAKRMLPDFAVLGKMEAEKTN